VSGLDGTIPLYFAHDAQAAFDRVVDDCEREPSCYSAFPDLHADLAAALDRLRDGPVDVEIAVRKGKPTVTVPFSLGDLGYAIRGMLYSTRETSSLPAYLHTAATSGNFRPLAQLYYLRSASLGGAIANGMYLSVVCAEDVPFITDDSARRWSAGTFLGEVLIHDYRGACDLWDRGEIPEDYRDPVRADAPVLLLSGGRDPSTPPTWGHRAVQGLANGRHIVFPHGGHGVGDTPCGTAIVRDFFSGVPPAELDDSCVEDEGRRPVFKIPS
jgi:pimeloyl-ACP methyl ester carboxylesterase